MTQTVFSCDVLVVGAGFAGLAAAFEAQSTGARVVVLGRRNPFASNSAIAPATFALAGTAFQRQNGIEDSPELLARDILAANRGSVPEELVTLAADQSPLLYEWLVNAGARFESISPHFLCSVPRLHREVSRSGAHVLRLLLAAVAREDVQVELGTEARRLILDASGAVLGVQAERVGDPLDIRAAKGVVLAAGGFARDAAMVARYLPEYAGLRVVGGAGSTGDGIRMGMQAEGAVLNMDAAIATPLGHTPGGARIPALVYAMAKGAILVDGAGRRFGEESRGYARLALPVLRTSGRRAFILLDERIKTDIPDLSRHTEKHLTRGDLLRAETVQEMARLAGIDEAGLEEAADGRYPTGPLYGAWMRPALTMTHGGLKVDVRCQVLTGAGRPIPHLYAAGDNTPGLGGAPTADCSCPGYIAGTGYLWAFASGRTAGRNAALEAS